MSEIPQKRIQYWLTLNIYVQDMLIHDTLDKIAEETQIPTETHEYLHVNSREAWVDTMALLIENGHIKPSPKMIKILAENWEDLLCRKYSNLN